MPNAFAAAAAVLFADPNLSVAAVLTIPGRLGRSVRVIRRDVDVEQDVSGSRTLIVGATFEVLQSACPERPTSGTGLLVEGTLYSVFDATTNERRGSWVLSAQQT